MTSHMNMSSASSSISWPQSISDLSQYTTIFVFLLLFHLLFPEIHSSRSYYPPFLLRDQLILFFLLFICVTVFAFLCIVSSDVYTYIKVKWSRDRPDVDQRVGRGIALLFHDRGTRRGWVVSSKPRPHFTPWKDPVAILQEAGWAPGSIWTDGKYRPHRDSIPDRPARSQSL